MTLTAAQRLDEAWAVYKAIAMDDSNMANQTPSWEQQQTPYDFAALLVQSLFPYAYNYPPEDTARTEIIWEHTIDAMEILPIDTALHFSNHYLNAGR